MNDSIFNSFPLKSRKISNIICRVGLGFWLTVPICGCAEVPAPVSEPPEIQITQDEPLRTGAEQMERVLAHLTGRRVGVVANPTAQVAGVHLVDTLLAHGVNLVRVFGPEHGFRGDAADGEWVDHGVDARTGIPVVSLYGKNKKPTQQQMSDLDVVVFDIQDVGVRFYTYISTLHLVMEAAGESGVSVLVLDRPNPHAHYIDGPVLNPKFSSFVGMHPIPLVHGMTVAELALMINGEGWLKGGVKCALDVVPCEAYARSVRYELPVAPSPNLPNMQSVYLYPSLGLFEGTLVSVGRGTDAPFQQIGMPGLKAGEHRFTPRSIPGVSKYPPHENKECVGWDLRGEETPPQRLNLSFLLTTYEHAPNKEAFFLESGFFNKLAGTDELIKQVKAGYTEEQIRATWKDGLEAFARQRTPYLLYED
ncbi:MAG: DUF1343 domain-containing protein [Cryomorphaceae bacterium]|nr:MAG: DUF1343 domain-containing protein [Cryomorphaceae bacterium]